MSPATQLSRSPQAMDNASCCVTSDHTPEVDEPPERNGYFDTFESPLRRVDTRSDAAFVKSLPPIFARRESLLTRQLQPSEHVHAEDEHNNARNVVRGMSTWSNPSVASTAELTSDNELTSPGTRGSTPSPPLPPTMMHEPVPILDKVLMEEPLIVGHNEEGAKGLTHGPEKTVEAGLGRRRCITFACGRKPSSNASDAPKPVLAPAQKPDGPTKRKSMITFACPAPPKGDMAPSQEKTRVKETRSKSPAPLKPFVSPKVSRAPISPKPVPKVHRGSDSTIKNESPKSVRKVPSLISRRRKYSRDNDDIPAEERRFHEFGASAAEQEQWLEESGCHRNRLTVNDTLFKENLIRRIGEEVEEEVLEEFDEDDNVEVDEDEEDEEFDEDEEDVEEDADEDEDDVDEGASEHEVSDGGFQTDDEEGFAVSDSDGDGSDNEWWAPGRSTAATSMEHLMDHVRPSRPRTNSESSLESAGHHHAAPRVPHGKVMKRRSKALKIRRLDTPDLPDSTDFVCGTLDEDRPLEQAYFSRLEQRKAAKHGIKPQDIDPTFPTSDPELDEEDEEDDDDVDDALERVDESDHPVFLHGKFDLHNEDSDRRGRHVSATGVKKKSQSPPHQRLRSPPPAKRTSHRSPPPPKRSQKSPPAKRNQKSPPPPRNAVHSPKRLRSPPPPMRRCDTPPPTRSTSTTTISFTPKAALGQRLQPTHTASLPRVSSAVKSGGKDVMYLSSLEHKETFTGRTTRGAIDIVKGLEKKRQRRKEKLYQKYCNRAGKDRERRPKPGRGAERMREVGLELAAYKGKKEHMLSY